MIPAETKDCSFFENIWIGPEANPASYSMGSRGTFLSSKAARAWGRPLTTIQCL